MSWSFCALLHPPVTSPTHSALPERRSVRKGRGRAVFPALRQGASPGPRRSSTGAEVTDRCSRAHVTSDGCAGEAGGGSEQRPAPARSPAERDGGCPRRAATGVCRRVALQSSVAWGACLGGRGSGGGERGMRKWVRNVTGRCAPTTHSPPRLRCGQRRPTPALESECLLLSFPSIMGGWLPGDPEGCVSCDPLGRKT